MASFEKKDICPHNSDILFLQTSKSFFFEIFIKHVGKWPMAFISIRGTYRYLQFISVYQDRQLCLNIIYERIYSYELERSRASACDLCGQTSRSSIGKYSVKSCAAQG